MKRLILAVMLALPINALAQDFPKMRAGLWQLTTATNKAGAPAAAQAPAHVTTLCIDDSVQKQMVQFSQGMMRGMCSKHDMRVAGDTVSTDSVCGLMGSSIATKAVMKFVGGTSYHTVAHSTYDPPLQGMKESNTIVDGKYTGGCPAGMAPGDMKLPGGNTINLKSITSGQ
jgi:hypothetical protein